MSWVTVIWSMTASACLTLAGMHLLVWCRQRTAWGNLLFSLTAIGVAGIGACELWMMRAETREEWGLAARWIHVPVWVVVLALVGFVRVYLGAGRPWLAWTICGLRTFSLVLNFVFTPNINFREITILQHVSFLGESVAYGEGVANPWTVLAQLSLMLLVAFVVDAAIAVWRRGERRSAIRVGFNMVFFVLLSTVQAFLMVWGFVHAPITPSLFFLGIVVGMAYELSDEVLQAAKLSRDLRESKQSMDLMASAGDLGVWVWDIVRDEIQTTDRARELFGFTKTEPLNYARFSSRLHPEDRALVGAAVAIAFENGGDFHCEHRVSRDADSERWLVARGRVDFAADGRPLRIRGVSIEITERKRAELEAVRHREALAHLSRVTMLGELSGSLAHELNQPLTAILSNAQAAQRYLAKDTPDLAVVREILADIVAEDERAGEVIRRLRLLFRKGQVEQQALDANEVVLEVLKVVRSDLANHGVSVETALAPDLAPIRGDRVQVQQVLLNLVMNGCDAMAGNELRDRRLTVRTRSDGESALRIEVSDVGRGLPDGEPERVFERYFTTKPHGLGLGLSVCRSIVAAHGGSLGAANNDGRGATFHCILPLAEEPRG